MTPPAGLPRVLPSRPIESRADHRAWMGELPRNPANIIEMVDRAGLRGRGGARFPTAVKLAAVARGGGRPVVVANGAEGEPASSKDKTLMGLAPHLVLDGAVVAASAVGASEAIVCIDRAEAALHGALTRAIGERAGEGVDLRVELAPSRYLAGEESALVHWLNGGEAKPEFVPPRPFQRGVGGRPTLVQNIETLAHLAQIARFGPEWFRETGTVEDPGTALVTVSGAVSRPTVQEARLDSPLSALLSTAGVHAQYQALLVGGYFGTWLPAAAVPGTSVAGAGLGCGAIVALPVNVCGLAESARITRWLANQTAGQCGPCVHGLAAIAGAMDALVRGDHDGLAEAQLHRWTAMVTGRGACKHPDGAARFVESSVRTFADEIAQHRRSGPCRGSHSSVMPLPAPGSWR